MIKVTAQQRANAIEFRDVLWPSVPPENVYFRLRRWRDGTAARLDKPPTCNTIACAGGWCAWWPSFRARGMACQGGAPALKGRRQGGPGRALIHLFGSYEPFEARGALPMDARFHGTDHELVTYRINWLIANSEVAE